MQKGIAYKNCELMYVKEGLSDVNVVEPFMFVTDYSKIS
jgi:hypothetical protein